MARRPHPRVALVSLGCPKNLIDSEMILAHLAAGGCVVGAPMDDADVIIVNACGFLSAAREESLAVIREALKHKQDSPSMSAAKRVIVAGCLVNRDADKLFDMVGGIDGIVGVNDRDSILSAVLAKGPVTRVSDAGVSPARREGETPSSRILSTRIACDSGRFRLTARHTAYLRISEGCNQRCTFCTIPAIRGPFRSKLVADVLAEARELAADGAVELNVIGQDTTTYGRDLPGAATNLAALLRQLNDVEPVRWIRLMYAYPRRFTDELIDAIADCPRVVKYVDLPLQHIADPILRRMGRQVTRQATLKLLDRLRRRIPGLVLRTTFIVGFPGEGERHFRELLKFVERFGFDALGVFEYSPEEGTPAMRLSAPVDPAIKADRAGRIMLAQQEIAFAANRRRIGQELEVLVDGADADGRCVGRHCGQAPDIDSVCILNRRAPAGGFVRVKVTAAQGYDLRVSLLE